MTVRLIGAAVTVGGVETAVVVDVVLDNGELPVPTFSSVARHDRKLILASRCGG